VIDQMKTVLIFFLAVALSACAMTPEQAQTARVGALAVATAAIVGAAVAVKPHHRYHYLHHWP
jgi:hypothetical protein